MKILESIWFTTSSFHCIGIVIIENETGERKAYIGTGEGHDEEYDIQRIVVNGAKITPDTLEGILKKLKGE